MVEENIQDCSMMDMLNEIEASMKKIHEGDIIKGRVISVSDKEVLVNIGYIADGIILKEELSDDPDISPKDIVKSDDELFVYVLRLNDDEGNVALSKLKADAVKIWDELSEAKETGKTLDVRINEAVKGGLTTTIKGTRAFIPASQVANKYVDNLNEYVGKYLTVKVIEVDKESEKIVLSGREVEKAAAELKKGELLDTLKKGDVIKGKVSRIAKFGAFVDLGGVDGLIHISELAWGRVKDASEVVSEGQEVEVYVLDVNKENGRISLALRDANADPWKSIKDKYKVDTIVPGKVIKLTDFGAFVELEPGVEGLVHISEISDEHITKPSSVLSIGDKVNVKILDIKEGEKRISLSIKAAAGGDSGELSNYINEEDNSGTTLGDLFKDKFKGLKLD